MNISCFNKQEEPISERSTTILFKTFTVLASKGLVERKQPDISPLHVNNQSRCHLSEDMSRMIHQNVKAVARVNTKLGTSCIVPSILS